jgi:hypothetical protein
MIEYLANSIYWIPEEATGCELVLYCLSMLALISEVEATLQSNPSDALDKCSQFLSNPKEFKHQFK